MNDTVQVPVKKIFVDEAYQRSLNSRRVAQMVKEFCESWFLPVILSSRTDDRYAALDGGHRVAVAKEKGLRTIAAVVHKGLSIQEEAALFSHLNGGEACAQKPRNAKLSPYDLLRGKLASGDNIAILASDIVTRAGYEFARGSHSKRIRSITQVLSLVQRNPIAFKQVMDILSGVESIETDEGPQSALFSALFVLCSENIVDKKLQGLIRKHSIHWLNEASLIQGWVNKGHGNHEGKAQARALLKRLNYRRKHRYCLPGDGENG